MVEISLLDKIKTTFSLIFSSPLFLILLLGIALMIIDIFFISKKKKSTKISYFLISLVIIVLLLQNYFDSVLGIFDTIAKNIVTIIYFPSVLEYIIMLLITLVVVFISLIKKKTNSKIKTINSFVLAVNLFLFFMILDEISVSEVDLSNKISIYTNEVLMVLFELSIFIFVVWSIGLILYTIIHKLIYKEEKKDNEHNFYDEIELPKTIEELRKQELVPEPKIEYIIIEKNKTEDMFTLEEYKQMKNLLEQIKQNQNK